MQKKRLTIYVITALIILFVFEVMPVIIAAIFGSHLPEASLYSELFSLFLFIGGCLYTSTLFQKDMFSKDNNHGWLMLPASTAEKFFAKGLMSIAFPFVLVIFFSVASVFIEGLLTLTARIPFMPFSPFFPEVWEMVAHALIAQSVFLLGGVFFRKAHFSKTILTLGIILIGLSMIAAVTTFLIFQPVILSNGVTVYGFGRNVNLLSDSDFSLLKTFATAFYWGILPLFCWITSYIRVEEVQYTDAV